MGAKILVSAGEASGDLYASGLVRVLQQRLPDAEFFGCPGVRMAQAGVRAVADQSKLAVVGLAEVLLHIPAIYGEYRKLVAAAIEDRPDVAILTDSSGFHLKVAAALKKAGIPVVYLVAPQAWAWRKRRVFKLKRNVKRLLCIFPFEEKFFRSYGVPAHYIGHPLAWLARPSLGREEFVARYRLDASRPLVALLPGSRPGEILRHLPILEDAVTRLSRTALKPQFVLGAPVGMDTGFIETALSGVPVKTIKGDTWELLSHCDVALTASGTVTVEGALLGAPMVTFYRVSPLTWLIGRPLVRVPFYSMVNLIAGRKVVPELIQQDATGTALAQEAERLLGDARAREVMRSELREVSRALATNANPAEVAANHVMEFIKEARYAHC